MHRITLALVLVSIASPATAIVPEDPPPSCDTPQQRPLNGCVTTRNQCDPPFGASHSAVIERSTIRQVVPLCTMCPAGADVVPDSSGLCACYVPRIQQLKDANVPLSIRYNIRFATVHPVPLESRQNLIVAFGGQNGLSGEFGGGPSNLTGQPEGWQWSCGDQDCGTQTFDAASLTARLMRSEVLGSTNTHAVVFPDHQYNWQYSVEDNSRIELGMTNFVKSLIQPGLGKTIVLTGHSRGGCLAMTVARRLQQDAAFRDVHLIVLPLDAVCNPDRWFEENFTITSPLDNPLVSDSGWYAWQSGYAAFSSLSESACVANIVGGAPWAWPVNVHGLSITPDQKPLNRFTSWWSSMAHDALGQYHNAENIGSFYYFVKNNLAPPACNASNCAGCCIHGVCVDGTATWGCGSGGAACNVCAGGDLCTNHACAPPPACGPSTCPNGCCTSAGVCVAGTSTSACGTGGAACVTCSAPSNATATCSWGSCGFQCNTGYRTCDERTCTKLNCSMN